MVYDFDINNLYSSHINAILSTNIFIYYQLVQFRYD